MPMKSPPHPGLHVRHDCLEPLGLSVTKGAAILGVTRQALNNLVNGKSGISPEMAIRLSKAFGGSPDVWLKMQMDYDLALVQTTADKIKIQPVVRPTKAEPARGTAEHLADQASVSSKTKTQATSPELTGGSGFTYEDLVVAYYLAALLREERVAGQTGTVASVAVQQSGHGHPMDDLIVELNDDVGSRTLALQVKSQLRISASKSNTDFREIVANCIATRAGTRFQQGRDAYGFVVENVANDPFRSLNRLIAWAKASPTGEHFDARFGVGGSAAEAERTLRDELKPLLGVNTLDEETSFFRHLIALKFDGLREEGLLRAEIVNRLQELLASNEDGQDILLFDRLCHLAREAAGKAYKWTRSTLLNQLRGFVRLHVTPSFNHDIKSLEAFSLSGLADVSETIDDFHVARPALHDAMNIRLTAHRLVNISGLPGCGKSAVLKRFATEATGRGPVLFLKADRLIGTTWATFAAALGLHHLSPAEILAEISATGTAILFVDGIDRIKPDQKGIMIDLLKAIETDESFAHWRVLASSRDQGLEAYRAWFPTNFYRGSGIGDVAVKPFSDEEADALATAKPHLRRLLFGAPAVREIARRPFFAAVLARSLATQDPTPQTEVDLITAWWTRAGHDAPPESVPQRQRALLDLAEAGVHTLGKNIPARSLKDSTFSQVGTLKGDLIIDDHRGGALFSFSHDIFFEWTFFRLLIELEDKWHQAVIDAGEPPLLGRVIGLLAQSAIATIGRWSSGYRALEHQMLRAQWHREWLTAPPFTTAFASAQDEFTALLLEDNFVLLEKLLVWFQAQHTIPSPVVLQRIHTPIEGIDNVRLADTLGWPSDFQTWGRLLDSLTPLARTMPIHLLPHLLVVFGVWQNALSDYRNPRSATIIDVCSAWLIDLEYAEDADKPSIPDNKWRELGREARSQLASSLRTCILRSARAYPEPAIALFERAVNNKRMRDSAYSDLIAFTPIMSEVAPDAVLAVAEAELMEELPQDRYDRNQREEREHYEWLERLRSIPEADRTEQQRRALQYPHISIGHDRPDLDDIGIQSHNTFYFPPSALHEPFASLLANRPEAGLRLIRDLSNHAVKGWRQVYNLNQGTMGTPVPVTLEFPWGQQTFWGDWRVYSWFLGELAPHPLECAYLALSYWAFRKIDEGTSPSEIIKLILEGNECYAVLGLALVLALETYEVSEVTLPIVSCQRLWHHDFARVAHEPTRNIDLLGVGFLSRLTGAKAQAKEYLDQRKSRSRLVRELAMMFALNSNEALRERFRTAVANFPNDLPYEIEEARTNLVATTRLMESAERWSGLGDRKNYRRQDAEGDKVLISYEPPTPLSPEQERRLAETTTSLSEQNAFAWASKSLQDNGPAEGWTLNDAVAFAKECDHGDMFIERKDVGDHAAQSAVSAIAACAIRFGHPPGPDHDWAWDVMARVEFMAEPERFSGSKIPWHPTLYLVVALAHDRRCVSPREDTARRLFMLTAYPIDDVAFLAFRALFSDAEDHIRWIAAQLAMDYSIRHRPSINDNGERDDKSNRAARERSLIRALENLENILDAPVANMPPAWVKAAGTPHVRRSRGIRIGGSEYSGELIEWVDPNPYFDAQFAAAVFPSFPVEAWCQSTTYEPMFRNLLTQLITWTAERLMPSWRDTTTRNDREPSLSEWNATLGDLMARAAPFFDAHWVRQHWLAPFLAEDEMGLQIITAFAEKIVTRHILDAAIVPANALPLLNDIVERVVRDSTFKPEHYRAGEVHGYDMPTLIEALLFVSVEKAPGAARFVNGDWSQIELIMPIVSRLVSAIGWSPFVMQKFLTLCDRAGAAYPIDAFSNQANAALSSIANAKGSWAGTTLPARMAAVVQRLADCNYPLDPTHAQALLKVLDALIDLGDRRSVALEQSEAFRSVQGRSTSVAG